MEVEKSTLLKILQGSSEPTSGMIQMSNNYVVTLWGTAPPAASTILGGWPAFFVTFGLAMVHDLTTTWRELHLEE